MPIDLPDDELRELGSILDSGELHLLRDTSGQPRYVRQDLTRFTDRVWLFPFGGDPDERMPLEVFWNGLCLRQDHEFRLVRVGSRDPVTALVVAIPVKSGDSLTSTYTMLPGAGR